MVNLLEITQFRSSGDQEFLYLISYTNCRLLIAASCLFSVQSVNHVNSLWPHGLQHTRLPCPSLFPKFAQTHVHWVSDAIQPSYPLLIPFSSCLQSFPAPGSFPASIETSTSASVLPMNSQGWVPLRMTCLISLHFKGLSSLLQHHISKASILRCSAFLLVQLSHPNMTTGKTMVLTIWIFFKLNLFVCFLIAVIVYLYCSILALFISWRNGGAGSGKKTEMKNRERAQEESGLCVCIWAGGKFCVSALTWKKNMVLQCL